MDWAVGKGWTGDGASLRARTIGALVEAAASSPPGFAVAEGCWAGLRALRLDVFGEMCGLSPPAKRRGLSAAPRRVWGWYLGFKAVLPL